VSTLRSTFGAIQNRFESTISNLQATAENLTASRSRIQDTDFAAETASLTRSQILQQAGVAMLAQANALPQQVLTLIRG
jgi:flagellin